MICRILLSVPGYYCRWIVHLRFLPSTSRVDTMLVSIAINHFFLVQVKWQTGMIFRSGKSPWSHRHCLICIYTVVELYQGNTPWSEIRGLTSTVAFYSTCIWVMMTGRTHCPWRVNVLDDRLLRILHPTWLRWLRAIDMWCDRCSNYLLHQRHIMKSHLLPDLMYSPVL